MRLGLILSLAALVTAGCASLRSGPSALEGKDVQTLLGPDCTSDLNPPYWLALEGDCRLAQDVDAPGVELEVKKGALTIENAAVRLYSLEFYPLHRQYLKTIRLQNADVQVTQVDLQPGRLEMRDSTLEAKTGLRQTATIFMEDSTLRFEESSSPLIFGAARGARLEGLQDLEVHDKFTAQGLSFGNATLTLSDPGIRSHAFSIALPRGIASLELAHGSLLDVRLEAPDIPVFGDGWLLVHGATDLTLGCRPGLGLPICGSASGMRSILLSDVAPRCKPFEAPHTMDPLAPAQAIGQGHWLNLSSASALNPVRLRVTAQVGGADLPWANGTFLWHDGFTLPLADRLCDASAALQSVGSYHLDVLFDDGSGACLEVPAGTTDLQVVAVPARPPCIAYLPANPPAGLPNA